MEAGLRCVVFSRDRAMQLDAFLHSVNLHAPDLFDELVVLYRPTSGRYVAAYAELRRTWSHVRWLAETSFKSDLLGVLGQERLLVFHTDDDVFFRDVDRFELHDDEVCFTLRLGLNTTYCYPLDIVEKLRGLSSGGGRIVWPWECQGPGSYGYPLALNGHVLRQDEARGWLERADYTTPNELEASLQQFLPETRPLMASFVHSRVVSIPANIVNETYTNRHGGLYGVAELNDRFLSGERIDVRAMTFDGVNACHAEIPYVFVRP